MKFLNALGTSALLHLHILVAGNKIAYVVGNGVVVASLNGEGAIRNQRLFTANTAEKEIKEDQRDSYGFHSTCFIHGREQDSSSASPSKLKDKVRAVSCVTISPNGRVLAVGESGFLPRFFLYSLAPDASATPFAIIYEHTFGVSQLRFSPDSKYLCSLGHLQDGFLHIWKYSSSAITLRAGNKCTSVVNRISWFAHAEGTYTVVAAGLRLIKLWRFIDTNASNAQVLKGRNVLLGELLDRNFLDVFPINEDEMAITTASELFILPILDGATLTKVADISAKEGLVADPHDSVFWYFDLDNNLHSFEFSSLGPILKPEQPQLSQTLHIPDSHIIATFNFGSSILVLSRKNGLDIIDKSSRKFRNVITLVPFLGARVAANGQVLGYSADGDIYLVDNLIERVYSHQLIQADEFVNEITALEYDGEYFYVGDKYGQLSTLSKDSEKAVFAIKAHSSTVNAISYFKVGNFELLASISRDRMVQVFVKDDTWTLLRTLPTHNGNLLDVTFKSPYLVVSSSDRSVSIHEFSILENASSTEESINVTQRKLLALKSTPCSFSVHENDLFILTVDKQLHIYDLATMDIKKTLKLTSENGELVGAEKVTVLPDDSIAVACTDKALRRFSLQTEKRLSTAWGLPDVVLALVSNENTVHTIGAGCCFSWSWLASLDENIETTEISDCTHFNLTASPLYGKVARKILPLSTPKCSTRAAPKSPEKLTSEPDSPTPKLTSATLKRREAKLKAQLETDPDHVERDRTSRLSSSPSRTSPIRTSLVAKPTSRSASPTKPPVARSPPKFSSNIRLSKPEEKTLEDSVGSIIQRLDLIAAQIKVKTLTDDQKSLIRERATSILLSLGESDPRESILERYSEDLVELVRSKLEISKR